MCTWLEREACTAWDQAEKEKFTEHFCSSLGQNPKRGCDKFSVWCVHQNMYLNVVKVFLYEKKQSRWPGGVSLQSQQSEQFSILMVPCLLNKTMRDWAPQRPKVQFPAVHTNMHMHTHLYMELYQVGPSGQSSNRLMLPGYRFWTSFGSYWGDPWMLLTRAIPWFFKLIRIYFANGPPQHHNYNYALRR